MIARHLRAAFLFIFFSLHLQIDTYQRRHSRLSSSRTLFTTRRDCDVLNTGSQSVYSKKVRPALCLDVSHCRWLHSSSSSSKKHQQVKVHAVLISCTTFTVS